jgi:hypothetical protein
VQIEEQSKDKGKEQHEERPPEEAIKNAAEDHFLQLFRGQISGPLLAFVPAKRLRLHWHRRQCGWGWVLVLVRDFDGLVAAWALDSLPHSFGRNLKRLRTGWAGEFDTHSSWMS